MHPHSSIQAAAVGPVKKWLRVPDAIDYSNMGRSILYKEIKNGRIKSVKIKGIRMVNVASIDQFIESFA
jgi:hypothetical protein